MVRNQVYFDDELDKELKLLVATGHGNFSQLVREGAWEIVRKKKKVKKYRNFDPWKDFIGKGGLGGPKDLSKNIDYYLYIEPYENKKK